MKKLFDIIDIVLEICDFIYHIIVNEIKKSGKQTRKAFIIELSKELNISRNFAQFIINGCEIFLIASLFFVTFKTSLSPAATNIQAVNMGKTALFFANLIIISFFRYTSEKLAMLMFYVGGLALLFFAGARLFTTMTFTFVSALILYVAWSFFCEYARRN